MSTWVDLTKIPFSITTSDGVVYTPNFMNANKSFEYNVAEFNFRNLAGTLVKRRKTMGAVYNLELHFQGADCISKAAAFQTSSNRDGKPWTVKHPFYGTLTVQPISPVYYDNANNLLNNTKVTVTVRETIGSPAITNTPVPADQIAAAQKALTNTYTNIYVTEVSNAQIVDVQRMQSSMAGIFLALQYVGEGQQLVTNAIVTANSAINNTIATGQSAISPILTVIALPATLPAAIADKIRYIAGEFQSLAAQVSKFNLPRLKTLWMAEAGSCISAMCLASMTGIGASDYRYSKQVLSVIASVTMTYNAYLSALDGLQTFNSAEPDSWSADADSLLQLDNLFNLTMQGLYLIQQSAKQPKTITLTRDSNIYTIAWKLYGLLPDDSTIDQIVTDNNIGSSELIQVRKGRQILYYV